MIIPGRKTKRRQFCIINGCCKKEEIISNKKNIKNFKWLYSSLTCWVWRLITTLERNVAIVAPHFSSSGWKLWFRLGISNARPSCRSPSLAPLVSTENRSREFLAETKLSLLTLLWTDRQPLHVYPHCGSKGTKVLFSVLILNSTPSSFGVLYLYNW